MIPDQFPHTAPRATQVELLLACLALPHAVEAGTRQALLNSTDGAQPGDALPLGDGWRLESSAGCGLTLYHQASGGASRRWLFADGGGQPHGLLRWSGTGERLIAMALRLPDGSWMEVSPAAAQHALWGTSDLLEMRQGRAARQVAAFEAVDYGCISHIPPLDRPGDLPPGAGEALLNTLAMLMRDQGRENVRYRGPYPTEHLFHSLERSFYCALPEEEGLQAFVREEFALAVSGALVESPVPWRPAPFEPVAPEADLLAAVRDGVQAVWLCGWPYRRRGTGGGPIEPTTGAGGARVWREDSGQQEQYRVGLVLLAQPYRVYCTIDARGQLVTREHRDAPPSPGEEAAPASALWKEAVFAWAAYNSTPALAPAILALASRLPVGWAHLPHALAAVQHDRLLLQSGAFVQFSRLRDGQQDAALALMLISDLLSGAMPVLRRRAQAELAAEANPDLAALRDRGESARQTAGETLARIVPALVQALEDGSGG